MILLPRIAAKVAGETALVNPLVSYSDSNWRGECLSDMARARSR